MDIKIYNITTYKKSVRLVNKNISTVNHVIKHAIFVIKFADYNKVLTFASCFS